jgi:hypothetical protein
MMIKLLMQMLTLKTLLLQLLIKILFSYKMNKLAISSTNINQQYSTD